MSPQPSSYSCCANWSYKKYFQLRAESSFAYMLYTVWYSYNLCQIFNTLDCNSNPLSHVHIINYLNAFMGRRCGWVVRGTNSSSGGPGSASSPRALTTKAWFTVLCSPMFKSSVTLFCIWRRKNALLIAFGVKIIRDNQWINVSWDTYLAPPPPLPPADFAGADDIITHLGSRSSNAHPNLWLLVNSQLLSLPCYIPLNQLKYWEHNCSMFSLRPIFWFARKCLNSNCMWPTN